MPANAWVSARRYLCYMEVPPMFIMHSMINL